MSEQKSDAVKGLIDAVVNVPGQLKINPRAVYQPSELGVEHGLEKPITARTVEFDVMLDSDGALLNKHILAGRGLRYAVTAEGDVYKMQTTYHGTSLTKTSMENVKAEIARGQQIYAERNPPARPPRTWRQVIRDRLRWG